MISSTNTSTCNSAVSASLDNFRFMTTFYTDYVLASKTKLQHPTDYFLVSLQRRKPSQLAKQ